MRGPERGGRRWLEAALGIMLLGGLLAGAAPGVRADSYTFPETGKTVRDPFLAYWRAHGGLAQYGYPLTEEMQERSPTDGQLYTVQYFERSVLEHHPANAPPYDVLPALLGAGRYQQLYPQGAPNPTPNTGPGSRRFAETGKRLGGRFLQYWTDHGGVIQQGLPVSDEFQEISPLDGKPYTVQYFERAIFEYHPENAPPYDVLLAQLGTLRLAAQHAPGTSSTGVGTLQPVRQMSTPRACHTATLLPNGTVLVAGGMVREGQILASAELYNPTTSTFTPTGAMTTPRVCHAATLLPDGTVLIVGGWGNGARLASAERYDPATGRFTATGNMAGPRDGFSLTRLADGRILIAGGSDGRPLASAELYDPATGQFTPTGAMGAARTTHTATLLTDGQVLLVGGEGAAGILTSAERYNPVTGQFRTVGTLAQPRHKHAAWRLPDGRVLIVGGADGRDWRGRQASAEIFDPAHGTFTPTGAMTTPRFKFSDAVTPLPDGRLLIAGGGTQAELYQPATGTFAPAHGQLDAARFYTTATALPDGRVLILGGYDTNILATAKAWIYTP